MAANTQNQSNGIDGHTRLDMEKSSEDASPLRRSAWRALVQDFSPLWFTWCMNSGIIGILTQQCPYQFDGLKVISTIFFVFDLVLFTVFSIIFLARFAIFRKAAYNEIANAPVELVLMGCWPIAFMTLTSLVGLIVSNAYWGGHAFTIVAYVMWWICVAWSLITLSWVFITLFRRHDANDRVLPPMVIIPAVSVSTVAVTGGIIAEMSYQMSPRLAVPLIIVSFMMVGVGILLGLMLITYCIHALLARGFPPPGQSPSLFLFVGPMGQSAAALQALGSAASTYGKFGGYNKGVFLTAQTAPALDAACTLIALMLSGLGVVFMVFAVYLMAERAVKRELFWTMTWNSIIFPTGTLITSFLLFSVSMDSPAFRGLTAAGIIFLIMVFLLNLGGTILRISQGKLLIVKEDPRVKQRIAEEQKGK